MYESRSKEQKKKKFPSNPRRNKGSDTDDTDEDNNDEEVSISKGHRVEAKLKEWTKYYKCKITRITSKIKTIECDCEIDGHQW